MSDEDWDKLPAWSDVEDDPAYNVRVPSRVELHGPPPMSCVSVSSGFTQEQADDARESSSVYSNETPRMAHMGELNARLVLASLGTPGARGYVRGTDGVRPGNPAGPQESWWSIYHNIGDVERNMSPPIWIITSGRPPTPDADAVRWLFREDTPTQPDPTQSDSSTSESTEAVRPNLRGGGGWVHSELFKDYSGLTHPADWLQLLRAQSNHQTIPFRFKPSTRAKTQRKDALFSPRRLPKAHVQNIRERIDYDESLANRLDQECRGRTSQRQSSGLAYPPPLVVRTTSRFRENYMIDGPRKHDHDRFGVPIRHRSISASSHATLNHDLDDSPH
ncbi:hypothetical protein PtrSN002B_009312, partial [Pyrenophora tritici-repentis]